jgi:hypothetical protein
MALKMVSRQEWGAQPPKAVTMRAPSGLSGVAVHWFGKPRAAASHDGCAALLRGVQSTHMAPGGLGTEEGANDIGYNHAVCPHGLAFDLRGFGVQTGANGDARSNRDYAAVVYMAGKGDELTDAGAHVLADLIRLWQSKGAGPLVKPHHFFVRTECPGPELTSWIELRPPPWRRTTPRVAAASETPSWLMDFMHWRLAQDGDPKLRPTSVPKRIPNSAWEALALTERLTDIMGPQQSFLDWVEWRRQGGRAATRPRSLPAKIPKAWVVALERLEGAFEGEPPATGRRRPSDVGPAPRQVTKAVVGANTKLLASPRSTRRALEGYMLGRKHGSYSDDDVRDILALYWTTAKGSGLDPLIVVSQLVLETGNLTSRWSQPPRRNPAGIGVTGAPGVGVSFASWDEAVVAHVGRLLAYAVSKGKESSAQRRLIDDALEVRSLPDSRRGCAPTLDGLAGTWAMDQGYAEKIARIANEIGMPA